MNRRSSQSAISRRAFCTLAGAATLAPFLPRTSPAAEISTKLPIGAAPAALDFAWFPSRLHAFLWKNWPFFPPTHLAKVVDTSPENIGGAAKSMGLTAGSPLSGALRKRASLTIIRANWHLLPYEQLLALLGWTEDELAYTLREDDFFFLKLGLFKPKVSPLRWTEPGETQKKRAAEIAVLVRASLLQEPVEGRDPMFSFVANLSQPPEKAPSQNEAGALRLGYSYFALYGDPLIDPALDPYPDGYLARLAASGVNAVWLQGVLARLAPLPWAHETGIDRRRAALRDLASRAARHGIKIFLYLNEPRALPATSPVFQEHPDWKGVGEQDHHALCTSAPEVRTALREALADLCRAVPDLGGFFTITASENLTNCWSHGRGQQCPQCQERQASEVIAELNATFFAGLQAAGGKQQLIVWDWGWADAWALDAIERLPVGVTLMSVSEWGLAIERGGVKSTVGEYCLSAIGPGPRALRHWAAARKRGLSVAAKLQLGVTWEIAAVPFLPVLENIADHLAALREAGVTNFMLGWTLGGHPSPNLEIIKELASGGTLDSFATRRHGEKTGPAAAEFWRACSAAYREFPFHVSTVYEAPVQMGPANPLWLQPTGYRASMVGLPYDDLERWRSIYPAEIFATQLEKVAAGFEAALAKLRAAIPEPSATLAEEMRCIEAAAIHYSSTANQSRFVLARTAKDAPALRRLAATESALALRLHALRSRDSRLGFEASNEYFYTPCDLVEKIINCQWIAAHAADAPPPAEPLK